MDMLGSSSRGYPRPQLERGDWASLEGTWMFALDHDLCWRLPAEVRWDGSIQVPFSPETPASGVGRTGFYRACWYQRVIEPPPLRSGERLLLHLGAVDYSATVWINGTAAAEHTGGYTPFTIDLTPYLGGPLVLVVRAVDDPHGLAKPRGKQDWLLDPHGIWYPRTTGIWQTVWLERVPATWIGDLRWTPNLDRWEVGLDACLQGDRRDGLRVSIKLHVGDKLLADDTYAVVAGEVHRRVAFSDPGLGDSRNELLWSPESPTLIRAEIQLWAGRGELLDEVRSYTALRSIGVEGERIVLNGRPYFLRMVLDQGYWPDTGMTAPSDQALQRDVALTRAMGFNGVRKHQKVEDSRYLYWADVMGLLVRGEMPSAYRPIHRGVDRARDQRVDARD